MFPCLSNFERPPAFLGLWPSSIFTTSNTVCLWLQCHHISLRTAGKESLLLRTRVIRLVCQIIQDDLPITRSTVTLTKSLKSLLSCKVTYHRFLLQAPGVVSSLPLATCRGGWHPFPYGRIPPRLCFCPYIIYLRL